MIATVDSNVVIDVFADRMPFVADSQAVLDLIEKRAVVGVFASHAITTLYYAIRKGVNKQKAEEAVAYVLDYFQIWGVTKGDWQSAMEWRFADFEDAGMAKVAELSRSRFLVTRNGADFTKGPVATVTPTGLLQMIRSRNPASGPQTPP